MQLEEHFFRHEAGRLVAVLTRLFGTRNLALAEDVVQDAFCRALETWKFHGVPENPTAWLMAVARNRALDVLRRERTALDSEPELARFFESEWTLAPTVDAVFGQTEIRDDLLRMMFSCCDPQLAEEAQVALILSILCGFSVNEIAHAFFSTEAAIEKRITRAKKVLTQSGGLFDVSVPAQVAQRVPAVHRALYLLFNEGYHGASPESAVRVDLCREAIRLSSLLLEHRVGATPATYALAALFHLNAARLPARLDASGNLHALPEQDRSLWDQALVAEGLRLLDRSATGPALTPYHVEAAIAAHHAEASSLKETNWRAIVSLYDALMELQPSPIVALNRAIAVAQLEGPERGLEEISAIENRARLDAYPFYSAALGELELRRGRRTTAHDHFRTALGLARNPMERRFLEQRLSACGGSV